MSNSTENGYQHLGKGKHNILKRPSEDDDSEDGTILQLPEDERNVLNAKMQLLTQTKDTGTSLYEHLAVLISGVLEHRPENAVDHLEDISCQQKCNRMTDSQSTVRDCPVPSKSYQLAMTQYVHFQKVTYEELRKTDNYTNNHEEESPQEDEHYAAIPNLMKQAHNFQMAGEGLPMEEYSRIALSLMELVKSWPIETVRFWGKVFGIKQNYYVVEAEFGDGDYESDMSDEYEEDEDPAEEKEDSMFDDDSATLLSMKPVYKPPPKIPCEAAGTGLNRKVYFVCSEPCQPWCRLPHVTPRQIVAARKIRKFLTGFLNHQMVTNPPFPGLEKNYLRAQIARISASTHVSPSGYYKFDEDEEEEEGGGVVAKSVEGARDSFVETPDYEGLNVKELSDPGVDSWVHHSPFVLPQGRTSWFNPMEGIEREEHEEEEEEEERNEPDEPEPEHGPTLLTPISQDSPVGESPAWIAKASSQFVPEYSVAVLHSNVWPGAVAFASDKGRFFENVYIGWGQKNTGVGFEPSLPEPLMTEFPSGPEVVEAEDPTPETEAAVRSAMREKELIAEEEKEEAAVLEEEEEDEDEDGEDGDGEDEDD